MLGTTKREVKLSCCRVHAKEEEILTTRDDHGMSHVIEN